MGTVSKTFTDLYSKVNNMKLYSPHDGSRHLSTIPVKDSHSFKIVESVFSFYLKLHNFKQVSLLLEWWTTSLIYHEDLIDSF